MVIIVVYNSALNLINYLFKFKAIILDLKVVCFQNHIMEVYENPKMKQVMNKILDTELKITHEQLSEILNYLTKKETLEVPGKITFW